MNKKALRNSFRVVLAAATKIRCEDLHHKEKHRHKIDEMCPVKYEVLKHCDIVERYIKEVLK